eukprot:Opistho-2@13765
MAGRFRQSKYRNAVAKTAKREAWYAEIQAGTPSTDADNIKASCKFLAFCWESIGGGQLCVIPIERVGKVGRDIPLLSAHGDYISDFEFSPFDDNLLVTGSNDTTVRVWHVPDGGFKENHSTPVATLSGHPKRVECLKFNPNADKVLAVASGDIVKIWNLESNTEIATLQHPDIVQSLSWKGDGSLLATTCKDNTIRVWDPRANKITTSGTAHEGTKGSRVTWLGDRAHILTTGFSKTRERQFAMWDHVDVSKPLTMQSLDSSNGILMPFYDDDTEMLFLAGKGDSTIRFYETTADKPYLHEAPVNVTDSPNYGMTSIPKRAVDVMSCEVVRLLKLTKTAVVPISYEVPRKSHREFHDDIFPDTLSGIAPIGASAWAAGENGVQSRIPLDPSKRPKNASVASVSSTSNAAAAAAPAHHVTAPTTGSHAHHHAPSAAAPAQDVHKQMASLSVGGASTSPAPAAEAPRSPGPTRQVKRQSKYNHIEGIPLHKKNNIDGIVGLSPALPGEANVLEANSKYVAIPLSGPGGQVCVLPLAPNPRVGNSPPVLQNGSAVLDFALDPFDDSVVVVACEDSSLRVWRIPEGGLKETISEPILRISGHRQKINVIRFHPTARNVVATAGYDFAIKLWDLSNGNELVTIDGHTDQLLGMEFSPDGKHLATVCKDKFLRIFDARSGKLLQTAPNHVGSRGSRVAWLGKTGLIATTGFDRSSERQVYIFKADNIATPVGIANVDVSPAVLVPHYDEDTGLLFLVGRGDTSIHCFEIVNEAPYAHPLPPYKTNVIQQGVAFLHKNVCDVKNVEFKRILKLSQSHIEIVGFHVPRTKKEYFQDDVLPDTRQKWVPAHDAAEWFAGSDKEQPLVSLLPAGMKKLSEAPVEAPKERKFGTFNPREDTPEEKKEKLLNAMVNTLSEKAGDTLPQDLMEGVAEDEWD